MEANRTRVEGELDALPGVGPAIAQRIVEFREMVQALNKMGLRVVMEHITTKDGADYVADGGPDIAATITTHHLMITRNELLVGEADGAPKLFRMDVKAAPASRAFIPSG